VGVLAAGCTVAIDGKARPAPNLAPRPLTGQTVQQVLLDDAALSRILQQPFKADAGTPPWSGGMDMLRHPFDSASPADCVGVAVLLEKSAYQSGNVKDVAGESWEQDGGPARVISVLEGVVALPTAAEAGALFAKFSAQWNHCDGATLTLPAGTITFSNRITDVRIADSVVAATVSIQADSYGDPMPDARAIGVRANCLAEVEVTFYSTPSPSDRGSGDPHTSAVEIAHAMMDKVSALS
jgi:hypothetical protein